MRKRESIHVVGKIKSVSNPFGDDKITRPLITVETERGFYSFPVSNKYAINQKVEIYITILNKEEPGLDV